MDNILQALNTVHCWLITTRNERGQGTLEYVGMIIVAAILVVAVLEATDSIDLGARFTEAIEEVIG